MADKFLKIDTDKLKSKIALNIQKQANNIHKKLVKKASYALFDFIKAEAERKLKRKQFYIKNLQIKESPDIEGYRIILRSPASWIENGLPPRDLKEDMLKNGQQKRVIPLSSANLDGYNSATKKASAGQITFRTMSVNQPDSMWKTKAIPGIFLFKKAKGWFKEYIKTLNTKK